MWKIVLTNLKNGLDRLDSITLYKEPTWEEANKVRELYGAEDVQIVLTDER